MKRDAATLAREMLHTDLGDLTKTERRVLDRIVERRQISKNLNRTDEAENTFGERMADRVAEFGGSWVFIGIFMIVLFGWIGANVLLALFQISAFDPYPFIFLNLILSMLAAVQAPIIMMSQNRQAAKDRDAATHDYEVNLKAELEIMELHDKLDGVRQSQLTSLLQQQGRQIEMIEAFLAANGGQARPVHD
ncbi:DUF1003 domain-containing protein [uncultured Maricaulis sp.]|uniref:DUF1003 domain-containing protein n=1 Tax=uncultured Maricaulis sp. TaxID=174710 RepID=UPI0030DCB9B2|tara:strand:+ start:171572 stop:172147 length:576 start_codon:yes stop_codon:yes gene_type:complete